MQYSSQCDVGERTYSNGRPHVNSCGCCCEDHCLLTFHTLTPQAVPDLTFLSPCDLEYHGVMIDVMSHEDTEELIIEGESCPLLSLNLERTSSFADLSRHGSSAGCVLTL